MKAITLPNLKKPAMKSEQRMNPLMRRLLIVNPSETKSPQMRVV